MDDKHSGGTSLVIFLIYGSSLMAMITALYFARSVVRIPVVGDTPEQEAKFKDISEAIAEGAMAFLAKEYKYVGIFAIAFAGLMILTLDHSNTPLHEGVYSAISFLIGALTSSLSAFLGMKIATMGNVRTTIKAKIGLSEAFSVAFQSGAVMGFGLVGLAVFGLITMCIAYGSIIEEKELLMEMVAGFGLGGSTAALFGRVGGGIYTKAADVGADLVGKVEQGIPEDDPRNPAVIADNVGDNVGDIAGMGADLFGSCAEATCAALVIGATSAAIAADPFAIYFPIIISAIGIPISLITCFFARLDSKATSAEPILKKQLLISTVLMTIACIVITKWGLLESFVINGKTVTNTNVLISLLSGLWSGLLIGYVTEFYTSHSYRPVREVADASNTGPATNIIYGLALGYKSSVVPVIALAVTVYLSWTLAGMYGIAIAALGMISTIAIGLTIDAYGPVSDNAGGIAEMVELGPEIRERTDLLDAAGNTTAAIGKGFAIGSALLTALALFAAFLVRSNIQALDLLSPLVFAGLLVGGMLPFVFTAQTMKGVGVAANAMIEEVRRQFREKPGILKGTEKPDHRTCVAISTAAAIKEMIAPGMLVMLTPLVFGYLFGVEALAGLLAGTLVTGLVMAVSASNSGGAWDNAKKYIEAGALGGKGSEAHKAAVVGDTVGDPFKDTSGPSINILMKLMAILSLVFAPFFVSHGGVLLKFLK
ncbi:K(+)-stimulated pyrophosphate-energized sodium pump [Pseudobacteriovorax antillogorgiicola]|uniref:Putative K(+)-stimulated pyrophosphate-energized sodium pump n=2 Tax=Pseudobacteriovorax antillogorgiicola TaxID=1513793 RepID=A0A1Y6B8J0_9BACT|nr:K(+)-stimulated pyrophosphate-energized sodium pump [Pseudobacteriovorax antillogorgiicola]SME96595.1 K(+)-stimulated pyrophosphate-energized sodium pump [Pseudobacteriovorax antillogorgiicola]